MKILLINSVCGIGSTGRICTDLARKFEKEGHEVKIAYGRDGYVPKKFQKYAIRIGTDIDIKLHAIRTRVLDEHGYGSSKATKKFLEWAEEYNPDLVWIHNIHGYYINIKLLFDWIKTRPEMHVKWTLHDCWSFTGHCSHFSAIKCEQWRKHCVNCEQKKQYPASFLKDNCYKNFSNKKELFTGVKNMTLITPSEWLADLVKQSFLKEYPVEICYNKIDTNVFKPIKSSFRERYNLYDKKIILGVANVWNERKGLLDFYKLAQLLDKNYVIILVGLSKKQIENVSRYVQDARKVNCTEKSMVVYEVKSKIEKNGLIDESVSENDERKKSYNKMLCDKTVYENEYGIVTEKNINNVYNIIKKLSNDKGKISGGTKIICIPRTNSVEELVELYSCSDFFVNLSYEDNYPTVNLEAIACGTYVITYNTGGCKETLVQAINNNLQR